MREDSSYQRLINKKKIYRQLGTKNVLYPYPDHLSISFMYYSIFYLFQIGSKWGWDPSFMYCEPDALIFPFNKI